MSPSKSVARSILKWTAVATIVLFLLSIVFLIFLLPESVDHTFNLSNQRKLTLYHSGNIEFGFESFEGGNRKGYRIKAGYLRIRLERPFLEPHRVDT